MSFKNETTAMGVSVVRRLAYLTVSYREMVTIDRSVVYGLDHDKAQVTLDDIATRVFNFIDFELAREHGLDLDTVKAIVREPATLDMVRELAIEDALQ